MQIQSRKTGKRCQRESGQVQNSSPLYRFGWLKAINDTFGHQIGDSALIAVGNRLAESIRESDFAARLGGDEFAVIACNIESGTSAEQLAERVHANLQEKLILDTVECTINASVGVALYPDAGTDGETLLREADAAMYKIKRQRKGGIGQS